MSHMVGGSGWKWGVGGSVSSVEANHKCHCRVCVIYLTVCLFGRRLIRGGRVCLGAFRGRPRRLFPKTYVSDYDRWGPGQGAGGGWCRVVVVEGLLQMWLPVFFNWCIGVTNSALGVCFSDNTSALAVYSSPAAPVQSLFSLTHCFMVLYIWACMQETGTDVFPLILLRATIIPLKHWLYF